ncbi:hypothetical protein FRC12_006193 [Ceratobasidium sp. 428]|nr:hypothetical protein FRC09_000295 [Ceratobasidium sp. 395]KAG8767544.1 hypothetical protein FRC12_006193 [Ceratobasidium sp. 428]
MSHPHKFVEPVAEPIPASEPSLAATKSSVNEHNIPLSQPFPTASLTHLTQFLSTAITRRISKLPPTIALGSLVIEKLILRKTLVESIDALDNAIDQLQPGRKFTCMKHCPSTNTPPKLVDHKSISTEPTVTTPTPITTTESDNMAIDPPPPVPSRTYAEVAVGTPAHSDPKPSDPTPSRPTSFSIPRKSRPLGQTQSIVAKNPVRLVVRPTNTKFKQKPFAMLLVDGPSNPYRLLSHALSLSPTTKNVTLLGVHENRNGNLIVSLPCDTPDTTVNTITTVIHATFTPTLCFPLLITRDVAWTKLMVSSVKARPNPGAPTYSEEEVKASFLLNTAINDLTITRDPHWVRNPASITGAHSSFTFSFQDPDGSIGRGLAKSHLFMFGEPVHLKRWTDKPRQTRGPHSVP